MHKPALLLLLTGTLAACGGTPRGLHPEPTKAQLAMMAVKPMARPTKIKPRKARTVPNPYGLSPALLTARLALVEGRTVPDAQLRAIADHGDGFAAWTYAETLNTRDARDQTVTMATYYAIAAETGRAGGVPRIIELVERPEFASATQDQRDRLEKLLLRYAIEEQHTQAALFLIKRYNLGTPFGNKTDQVVALLDSQARSGDARIALNLATQILQNPDARDAESLAKARDYLTTASQSETLSIRTTAENLLILLDRRQAQATPLEATL